MKRKKISIESNYTIPHPKNFSLIEIESSVTARRTNGNVARLADYPTKVALSSFGFKVALQRMPFDYLQVAKWNLDFILSCLIQIMAILKTANVSQKRCTIYLQRTGQKLHSARQAPEA